MAFGLDLKSAPVEECMLGTVNLVKQPSLGRLQAIEGHAITIVY